MSRGFMCVIGFSMLLGGLKTSMRTVDFGSIQASQWDQLQEAGIWLKLGTSLLVVVGLSIAKRHFRSRQWIFPTTVLAFCISLYVLIFIVLQSASNARSYGWLFSNVTDSDSQSESVSFWNFYIRFDLWNSDIGLVMSSIFSRFIELCLIGLVVVLDMSLNLPTMTIMCEEDVCMKRKGKNFNANDEFKTAGISVALAGTFAIGCSYFTLSPTKINREAGGERGSFSAIVCMLLVVSCFFAGPQLLYYLCPQFLGGLLAFAGFDYCLSGLWDSRAVMQRWEMINIVLMVALSCITLIGPSYALLIGGGIGTLVFVLQYMKASAPLLAELYGDKLSWQSLGSGNLTQPNLAFPDFEMKQLWLSSGDSRSFSDMQLLERLPFRVATIRVQGYIFFGNVASFINSLHRCVEAQTHSPLSKYNSTSSSDVNSGPRSLHSSSAGVSTGSNPGDLSPAATPESAASDSLLEYPLQSPITVAVKSLNAVTCRVLMLDFSEVIGADTTAIEAISTSFAKCIRYKMQLIVVGLQDHHDHHPDSDTHQIDPPPLSRTSTPLSGPSLKRSTSRRDMQARLAGLGVFAPAQSAIMFFSDRSSAFRWIEEEYVLKLNKVSSLQASVNEASSSTRDLRPNLAQQSCGPTLVSLGRLSSRSVTRLPTLEKQPTLSAVGESYAFPLQPPLAASSIDSPSEATSVSRKLTSGPSGYEEYMSIKESDLQTPVAPLSADLSGISFTNFFGPRVQIRMRPGDAVEFNLVNADPRQFESVEWCVVRIVEGQLALRSKVYQSDDKREDNCTIRPVNNSTTARVATKAPSLRSTLHSSSKVSPSNLRTDIPSVNEDTSSKLFQIRTDQVVNHRSCKPLSGRAKVHPIDVTSTQVTQASASADLPGSIQMAELEPVVSPGSPEVLGMMFMPSINSAVDSRPSDSTHIVVVAPSESPNSLATSGSQSVLSYCHAAPFFIEAADLSDSRSSAACNADLIRYHAGSVFPLCPSHLSTHHLALVASSQTPSTIIEVLLPSHLRYLHAHEPRIALILQHFIYMQSTNQQIQRAKESQWNALTTVGFDMHLDGETNNSYNIA